MEEQQQIVKNEAKVSHGSLRTYVIGFIASIACTLIAYGIVSTHTHSQTFTHPFIISSITILALAQFGIQLFFFLHLGRETKPRWKLLVLSMMILIVCILVFGSLWIMNNLNYRMTPQQMNQYMVNQDGGL